MSHTPGEKWPDGQSSDGTQGGTADPTRMSRTDRRRFLQAAVVASVATAGAVGAAGRLLATPSLAHIRSVGAALSGPLTVTACFRPNAPQYPAGTQLFDASCSSCSDPSATLTYSFAADTPADVTPVGICSDSSCTQVAPPPPGGVSTSPYWQFLLTYDPLVSTVTLTLTATATRGAETATDSYSLPFQITDN